MAITCTFMKKIMTCMDVVMNIVVVNMIAANKVIIMVMIIAILNIVYVNNMKMANNCSNMALQRAQIGETIASKMWKIWLQ
jgi:hypothetical protein